MRFIRKVLDGKNILNDFVDASSLVTASFRRLACVAALCIPASPLATLIKPSERLAGRSLVVGAAVFFFAVPRY
jgi:hypothetical protein